MFRKLLLIALFAPFVAQLWGGSQFPVVTVGDTTAAEYISSHVDGVTATVDSSNKLVLTAADGRNITPVASGCEAPAASGR